MIRSSLWVAFLVLFAFGGKANAMAPLYDRVVLNIGITCQWQQPCQRKQLGAMRAAQAYLTRARPPLWRVHSCNKNARRGPDRVDWVGFNKCIRNAKLRPSTWR